MKNAIWMVAVCAAFVLWGCSPNPDPKTQEDSVGELAPDSSQDVVAAVDSLTGNEDASDGEELPEEDGGEALAEADKPVPESTKNPTKPQPAPKKSNTTTRPEGEKWEPAPPSPPKEESRPQPKPEPSSPKPASKPAPKPQPEPKPIPPKPEAAPKPSKPDHSSWDKLLRSHVSGSGSVDYKAMKGKKATLEAYLKHLEEVAPNRSWSSKEEMAYWINLYNAWTVKVIVDNYPVSSITKIDGGKTWDVKRVKSGSKTYSLSEVENKILRPKYNDARIHFAINCAAKSCPPLLNRAWTAGNLESYLERMTKQFVNDGSFNEITAKKARLSQIFEWYAVDFGNLINYINKYSNTQVKSNAKVEYIEYDWGLNGY